MSATGIHTDVEMNKTATEYKQLSQQNTKVNSPGCKFRGRTLGGFYHTAAQTGL